MKKVLFFATAAIFLTSCGNNQEASDKAKIDSMSQELTRQHIVDSMNNVAPVVGVSPMEANIPVTQGNVSSSPRNHHIRSTQTNNSAPVSSAPTTASAPVADNTTAAEIAAKKKADRRKLANSTAAGAMIGAGAGAVGGAIAGKNEHFKKEDALIGGGIGAVVGAGTGYLLQKHKLKKDTTK